MTSIILTILLVLLGAYFAIQNTTLVVLRFASFAIDGIPLYIVIIGSLLAGLVIGWVIQLFSTFSSSRTIHGKEKELTVTKKTVADLLKKIHTLEIENAALRGDVEKADDKSL